jgi:prenyltransferase beta subunit
MAKSVFSPGHGRVILRDIINRKSGSAYENRSYIEAAAGWLALAQDATPHGGASAAYSIIRGGWQPSYLETTGYIIDTMFDYAAYAQDGAYRNRAVRMADWLVDCQLENGAFQGGTIAHKPVPRVFNTGQIMIGLLRAYRETRDERYLISSKKAAEWLLSVQDRDGSWRSYNLWPEVPTYNTRVAWPLIELGLLVDCKGYVEGGRRYLQWAVFKQLPNGWIEGNDTKQLRGGLTHFLAYTASGFLESGKLLRDQAYIEAAQRFGDAILEVFQRDGKLVATYDHKWHGCYRFCCLTGNAQISVLWLQLYELTNDAKYLYAACSMNTSLKSEIDLENRNPGIRGALKGASPIWGKYMRFSYPNWATKFFLDALLLEELVRGQHARSETCLRRTLG